MTLPSFCSPKQNLETDLNSEQVDAVLRELGRAEAGLASKTREPVLTSPQFIQQYFSSFCEDPIMREIEKVCHIVLILEAAFRIRRQCWDPSV